MSSTFTLNKYLDLPTPGTETGSWGPLVNNYTFSIIDNALGGIAQPSLVTQTLTVNQTQNLLVILNGTLSSDVTYTFPLAYSSASAVAGNWVVVNNTIGSYNVYFTTGLSGGTYIAVPQSASSIIYSDGLNVGFADNRTITSATGGGSNQVFYLNDQVITNNYTIPSAKNAMTAGPISINSGVTVTINPPTVWTIV